jgi:AcrR family transcriptional regulator
VLDVAAQHFVDERFETVSVGEIAHEAHCSTATIYEVYGNKDNLFVCAMSRRIQQSLPSLSSTKGYSGLRALLELVRTRIDSLASPSGRAVGQAISRQPEIMQRTLSDAMSEVRRNTEETLAPLIRASFDEGTLRPLPCDVIRYNIMAISAYEATLLGLIYGIRSPVSLPDLIRNMFAPLVSEYGQRILDNYLQELRISSDMADSVVG